MRIAVNTRLLLKDRLEGLGTFTHEVMRRMVAAHPGHEFFFLFDRPYDPSFIYAPNVHPVVAGPPARHPVLFYAWFEWTVPRLLKKVNADVFLSPDGYLSLRSEVPQVPVMHDLNFHYFPEYFDLSVRKHYGYYFPRYAKKAARIATVSQFSKQDIVQQYGVPASDIDVVYNGASQDVLELSEAEKQEVRNEITGGHPYMVYIGALYPRKNLVNQLLAFDRFKNETGSDMRFVLIGSRYRESAGIMNCYEKLRHRDHVLFLGRVDPREKADRILAASAFLMYVSQFEGFGLPLLEATRCGVPAITADVTAMPEIGGDAVLQASPENIEQIADAMSRLSRDKSLRRQLVLNGKKILPHYTWEGTESRLWNCLVKAVYK